MQSSASTLLGLLVVLSVSGTTIALKCYYCSGEDCGNSFNTTNVATATCQRFTTCGVQFLVSEGDISRYCVLSAFCGQGDGCRNDVCTSCCYTNLCNDGPVPTPQPKLKPQPQPQPTQPQPDDSDPVSCYSCEYRSDTGGSSACIEEPFNPSGPEVSQVSCIGTCLVGNRSDNGVTHVFRRCTLADGALPCVPGCHLPPFNGCATCCSEALCNSGPVPSPVPSPDQQPPPQTQPPTSPPIRGQAATLAPKLQSALVLMAALAMLAM